MRPKTTNRDLPPRMIRVKRKLKSGKVWQSYYYNGRNEEGERVQIPLGHDLQEAKRRWAQLECADAPENSNLMRYIFNRYEREIIPAKADRTQRDNLAMLKFLRAVFDTAPIDAITPQMIAQYRDNRKSCVKGEEAKPAPVRANREITLLSHVFNMAREWGYTANQNPCQGVRKNKERPRDYYADNEVWDAVYAQACDELKAFIADEPEEDGEPDDKGAGKPAVGEEVGTDVNKPQPEKQYIEIVEKDSTGSKR